MEKPGWFARFVNGRRAPRLFNILRDRKLRFLGAFADTFSKASVAPALLVLGISAAGPSRLHKTPVTEPEKLL